MGTSGSGGFDPKNLSRGTQIAAAGSIIGLISILFFSWFKVSAAGLGSGTANGWDFGTGKLAFLALLLALVVLLVEQFAPQTTLPVAPSLAVLGLGALATLLVLLKIIIGEDADVPEGLGIGVEISRTFGIFLSLIAAAATAAGGYLKMSD